MEVWMMVNPRAGRQQARQNGERVRRVFALGGAHTHIVYTQSLEEAEAFLRKAAAARPDLLVCCGGDGTLSFAVETLGRLGAELDLGYVPMGTTNDFASSLDLPKEPARAAEQILRGKVRFLDLGMFGDRRFLYVASFGAFTQSSYKAPASVKAALGHLAYVLESARELPFLRACPLEVDTPGGCLEGEFLFGAVSNSLSIGGVMKLDPQTVRLNDGLLELTLVRKPKNPAHLGQIAHLLRRGAADGELVLQQAVEKAVFTGPADMAWSLDGEYMPGAEQVEVTVLPRALRLVL